MALWKSMSSASSRYGAGPQNGVSSSARVLAVFGRVGYGRTLLAAWRHRNGDGGTRRARDAGAESRTVAYDKTRGHAVAFRSRLNRATKTCAERAKLLRYCSGRVGVGIASAAGGGGAATTTAVRRISLSLSRHRRRRRRHGAPLLPPGRDTEPAPKTVRDERARAHGGPGTRTSARNTPSARRRPRGSAFAAAVSASLGVSVLISCPRPAGILTPPYVRHRRVSGRSQRRENFYFFFCFPPAARKRANRFFRAAPVQPHYCGRSKYRFNDHCKSSH